MKNVLVLFLLFAFFSPTANAQEGFDIRVKIDGYTYDTLWFGTTYGKRAVPQYKAVRQKDGFFNLKNESPLPSGMYAIIFKRGANASFQYLSCWLADGERNFTVETGLNTRSAKTTVTGSRENELLYQYFSRYYDLNDRLEELSKDWKDAQDEPSFRAFVGAEEDLARFQEDFILQNPGTLTAGLARQTQHLTPPGDHEKFADWQQEAAARHLWHRQHFFDNMDLGSGNFLKYPLWVDRTDFYFSKLPPPVPDSMTVMVEDLLHRLATDQDAYQYYLRYLLNSLSRMSRYQTDEVFVHLVRKYVDTGLSDWLGEDNIQKYRSDADRMDPLFVGKKSPDVTFYDKNSQPVSIYKTDAAYTLLVFWLYDCSHCKRELPVIKKLYKKYQSKGLKVMSICGKSGEAETAKCWEFAEQLEMPADWLLLSDPQRRSRFTTLLNVRSYPRMILLDEDKNILYKQNGEVPEAVLDREFGRVMP